MKFIAQENGESLENYIALMEKSGTWGGHLELSALCDSLYLRIQVYIKDQESIIIEGNQGRGARLVRLAFHKAQEHYDSIKRLDGKDEEWPDLKYTKQGLLDRRCNLNRGILAFEQLVKGSRKRKADWNILEDTGGNYAGNESLSPKEGHERCNSNPMGVRMEASSLSPYKMVKVESLKVPDQSSPPIVQPIKISLSPKTSSQRSKNSMSPQCRQGAETSNESDNIPIISPNAEEYCELKSKLMTELEGKEREISLLKEEIVCLRNKNFSLEQELESMEVKFRSKMASLKLENDFLLRDKDKLIENLKQECGIHQANNELQHKCFREQVEELNRAVESIGKKAHSNQEILESNRLTSHVSR